MLRAIIWEISHLPMCVHVCALSFRSKCHSAFACSKNFKLPTNSFFWPLKRALSLCDCSVHAWITSVCALRRYTAVQRTRGAVQKAGLGRCWYAISVCCIYSKTTTRAKASPTWGARARPTYSTQFPFLRTRHFACETLRLAMAGGFFPHSG